MPTIDEKIASGGFFFYGLFAKKRRLHKIRNHTLRIGRNPCRRVHQQLGELDEFREQKNHESGQQDALNILPNGLMRIVLLLKDDKHSLHQEEKARNTAHHRRYRRLGNDEPVQEIQIHIT